MCRALAVLRFLNLLEPGKPVLSITKSAMWLCLVWTGATITVALYGYLAEMPPLDTSAILANAISLFTTGALYSWRRYVQWKTGSPGLRPDPEDEP